MPLEGFYLRRAEFGCLLTRFCHCTRCVTAKNSQAPLRSRYESRPGQAGRLRPGSRLAAFPARSALEPGRSSRCSRSTKTLNYNGEDEENGPHGARRAAREGRTPRSGAEGPQGPRAGAPAEARPAGPGEGRPRAPLLTGPRPAGCAQRRWAPGAPRSAQR